MNLRNFIGTMLSATAGFAILPGATFYTRQWKPAHAVVGCDIGAGSPGWCFVMQHNGAFVSFNDPHSGPTPAWISVNGSGDVFATRAAIGTYALEPIWEIEGTL